ncbi:MAG: signal peptidase I [Chloroflexota bacterium]
MDNRFDIQNHSDVVASLIKKAAEQGESPSLTVISSSMFPLLKPGDCVFLEAIKFETLKKGDIITLWNGDALLTHRVVSSDGEQIQTRGDQNIQDDPNTPSLMLLGKVIKVKSRSTNKLTDLTSGYGLIVNRLIEKLSYQRRKTRLKQENCNKTRPITVTINATIRLLASTL